MDVATGSLYAKNHFDKESKKAALELVADIHQQFNVMLQELNWMDDATKWAFILYTLADCTQKKVIGSGYLPQSKPIIFLLKSQNISFVHLISQLFCTCRP